MRYFDSGVLVKLYRQEPNSAVAAAHVQATTAPIVLTSLHQLEIRTALRLMMGRGEISALDCQQAIAAFDQDRASGAYVERRLDWEKIFLRTEVLSAAHASVTLCRTLDALHVSIAMDTGASEICTFDQRQAALARLVGLAVVTSR